MQALNNILLTGNCGSGKTWVMKQLTKSPQYENVQIGLIRGRLYGRTLILGVYDGSMFEGSDKLSMAVAPYFKILRVVAEQHKWHVVAEGDRFTNSKYILAMRPTVIRIEDDGAEGRKKRGSKQTERHLKAIATRVANIPADETVANSQEAFERIMEIIEGENYARE